jgi:radical SAM superfamily enzyme
MSDKKPKVFSPKRHVRIDKMGGVVGECLRDEVIFLVDELNYTGTKLLELGIQTACAKHSLINGGMKTLARVETIVSGAS